MENYLYINGNKISFRGIDSDYLWRAISDEGDPVKGLRYMMEHAIAGHKDEVRRYEKHFGEPYPWEV